MRVGIKWTIHSGLSLSEVFVPKTCHEVCKAVAKLIASVWIRVNDSDYHRVRANFDHYAFNETVRKIIYFLVFLFLP